MNSDPDEHDDADELDEQDSDEDEAPVRPKKKKTSSSASSSRASNNLSRKESGPKGADLVPGGKTVFFDLDYNIAAALCYLPIAPIIGILWLMTENTKENSYLRFHCMQSLIFLGLLVAFQVAVGTVSSILGWIPMIGPALGFVFTLLSGLLSLIFMAICFRIMFSVYRGKEGRLPFIANIADRYSHPASEGS